ncbi:origin of replication complex subunit 3 [Arachis stenosperma]|uniref:origin of replication complex subunit 3 n=1 Tax=Arachis stenosperma TaxID=217475 RepID=UPI0025AB614C|nr:origin of replication complex subunit 3 [Arachis stenosperma]
MAPSSSPIVTDSLDPSTPTETLDNDLQPFFVLLKPSSRRKDRSSTGQGKLRKRNELSSPQNTKKQEGSVNEECDYHLFKPLQIEAFNSVWSRIESTIKDVLRDLNSSAFKDIQRWILECFNAARLHGEPNITEATRSFPILSNATPGQLSTALVITRNIEFVDDILTFEELGHFLKSHGCHVAKLSSVDFSIKNGIAGCLKALLREFPLGEIDSADISILASWYREQDNNNKPLVLIISDLERCCGSVLTEFVLMLSEWVVKLPVILIIGVATTVDALRNALPSCALQCLYSSKFMIGTPDERMDTIVEAVLVKHSTTFNIGHKVALFLRNYFINQDGTLTSFIRALKLACLLHFSMEPVSLIHGHMLEEDQKDWISALSPEILLKYMDEFPSYDRSQIASQAGKSIAQGLSDLMTEKKLWSTAVLCLCEAGKYSKVRLLDLFCEVLNPDLYPHRDSVCHIRNEKDQGLSSTNGHSQQYSSVQTGGLIRQIVRKVRDLPTGALGQLIKRWEKLTADISEIHDKLKTFQSSVRCEERRSPRKSSKDISKRYGSKTSLDTDNELTMLNLQAVAFIDCLVRNYMRPIECMPFHEISCFKNVEKLQVVLIGDPRRRIQADLLDSHKILRCSCCNKTGNALLPSRQDSSILYSLAQEHGDLINLHDWFQSFRTILHQTNKRKPKSKQSPQPKKRKDTAGSGDQNEASIQARFCRAVTEMQITGLLRMPSKRRPDFVQRVAFGL